MISLVNATSWDNWINYEEQDMKVRITNNFNLGEDIGTLHLKSHKSVNEILEVAPGEGRVTMYYEFNFKDEYKDGLGEVNFIDVSSGKNVDKDYYFVIWETIYEEKDSYIQRCNRVNNGTNISTVCIQELVGTYTEETQGWVRLDTRDIPKGKVRIGMATDVKTGDTIDGIWTVAGKKIKRHAVWTASLNVGLIAYFKMDEASGTTAFDSIKTFNLTESGSTSAPNFTGIIDRSWDFTSDVSHLASSVNSGISGNAARTISAWIFKIATNASCSVGLGTNSNNNEFALCTAGSQNQFLSIVGFNNDNTASTQPMGQNQWYNIVATFDGTTLRAYVDGISVINQTETYATTNSLIRVGLRNAGGTHDGLIDEIGIWDRALTAAEVTQLYNDGEAITWTNVFNLVDVDLNSPEDSSIVTSNVTFEASLETLSGFNLTNSTLFVWDSNGDIFTKQTNITNTDEPLNVSFIVVNLTSDNYEWNILGFAENNSGSVVSNFSASNNTFSWVPFEVENQTFNTNVFETSRQEFLINIAVLPSVLSIDAILNYNDTSFTADTFCSSGLCKISTAIDIPLVSSGQNENKSFSWEISIFDGTNSFSTNLTSNEQDVTRLNLEECNATFTVQSINFTAFDESTQSIISPFSLDGDFDFWLGTGTVKRNNSISKPSEPSVQMCLEPSEETFFLDGTIEYDEATGTNYTSRNYFFQTDTINNVSQNIKLGLLLSEDSTSFILKVQDRDILPVANVLIFTQRFYAGDGEFRTVQVSETDDSGRTVGFFETETVDYRFILKQNGQTVLITNKQKIVGEEVPFTLTFTIGEDAGSAWEKFEVIEDFQSSLLFNKASSVVSFTYADTSGDFTSSRLIVSLVQYNSTSNIDVCDVTSIQSSAMLSCNLTGNSTGTYIARALITKDGTTSLIQQIQFQIEDFTSASGNLGLLLGFFIILIASFMFKYNEIAGILMVDMAIIVTNMMGLISWGYGFISAIIAISIIILVMLER